MNKDKMINRSKSNRGKKIRRKNRIIKKSILIFAILGTSYYLVVNDIISTNATTNHKNNSQDYVNTTDEVINKYEVENNKNGTMDINKNDEYLKLVNRENSISADYKPNDLVTPNIRLQTATDTTAQVRQEVAVAFENMFNDAKDYGINLIGISGYRPYTYQETVYNNKVANAGTIEADKYVAKPGNSEHQTGLVMDILSTEYTSLDSGFENTRAFEWLKENMDNYGFILRYPKGKEDITGYQYEPWHLRYVGIDAAKEINEKQLTLEEYLYK